MMKFTEERRGNPRADPVCSPKMLAVPMLDLSAQHRPLHDDLRRALDRVISSNRFILGDEVAALERAVATFSGVSHGVGVSSGSDALLAMLMACGVGPGDEVVTTPYSFFATVEAIFRLGAKAVFADIDPVTLNLDPALAAERIGPRTKAVLVVHLFGRPVRLVELGAVLRRVGVPLLEDAAQAIGADGGGEAGEGGGALVLPVEEPRRLRGRRDGPDERRGVRGADSAASQPWRCREDRTTKELVETFGSTSCRPRCSP